MKINNIPLLPIIAIFMFLVYFTINDMIRGKLEIERIRTAAACRCVDGGVP